MTFLAALAAALWVLGPWACPAARAAGPVWVAPVEGPVAVRRAFSPPAVRWGAGHRGVDLASYAGAAIRAAGAGEVTYAGVLAGRGVLVVTHGALRTTYEPVSPLVGVGARVTAGAVVGRLVAGHAGSGRAGEALLHWGLLRGETYLDPLSLLARGPSRLVPVAPASPAPWGPAPLRAPALGGAPSPGVAVRAPGPDPPVPGPVPLTAPAAAVATVAAVAGAVTVVSRRSRGSP